MVHALHLHMCLSDFLNDSWLNFTIIFQSTPLVSQMRTQLDFVILALRLRRFSLLKGQLTSRYVISPGATVTTWWDPHSRGHHRQSTCHIFCSFFHEILLDVKHSHSCVVGQSPVAVFCWRYIMAVANKTFSHSFQEASHFIWRPFPIACFNKTSMSPFWSHCSSALCWRERSLHSDGTVSITEEMHCLSRRIGGLYFIQGRGQVCPDGRWAFLLWCRNFAKAHVLCCPTNMENSHVKRCLLLVWWKVHCLDLCCKLARGVLRKVHMYQAFLIGHASF